MRSPQGVLRPVVGGALRRGDHGLRGSTRRPRRAVLLPGRSMALYYYKGVLESIPRAFVDQVDDYHTRQSNGADVANGNHLLTQRIRSSERFAHGQVLVSRQTGHVEASTHFGS